MSQAEQLYPSAQPTSQAAEPAKADAPASTPEAPAEAPKPEVTPEAKPEEAKPAEAPKVEEAKSEEPKKDEKAPEAKPPVVPEKYDLKLPEGSLLHASYVEKIASEAKSLGLSQEAAQAVLDRDSRLKADFQSDLQSKHEQEANAWAESAKADQEIGGANHNRAVELSKRFIEKFATPAFKELLSKSRYGDHPEMVRMIWRAAKTMSEDQMVVPGSQAGSQKRSAADILYGSSHGDSAKE